MGSFHVERIISGGQTGVDRAALDVALELNIPCAGWCPRGRFAEDGIIPNRYPLSGTPTSDYSERTIWNVRDSDATLIITWGPPTGGTAFTHACALNLEKPHRVVDLLEAPNPASVTDWIVEGQIRVLNIAGPREGKPAGIYTSAKSFLMECFAHLMTAS